METRTRCPKVASGEPDLSFLVKHAVECLETDLTYQELDIDKEILPSINTEEDPFYTDGVSHAVHEFTPVPQTDEYIKTELMLDDEIIDNMNDSEANCRQPVPLVDHQLVGDNISDKESETGDSQERLRKYCERRLKSRKEYVLKMQLSTHAKERKREFACEICERTFCSKYSLERHNLVYAKKSHTKRKVSTFTCEVCGSSYAQKINLKMHMLRKHSIIQHAQTAGFNFLNTKPEQSLIEDAALQRQESQLNPTQSRVGTSGMQKETCRVCHKVYPTEYIRAHMRLAHSNPKHQCKYCSRSFKYNHNLMVHLNTHAKDREREFACELCERTFYSKSTLWAHRKIHSNDKYHCKVCGHRFTQKESLKMHMVRRQHFDETQQFTLRSFNDAAIAMKTELISDEEFVDEGKGSGSVNDAKGTQQSALAVGDEQQASVGITKDNADCEVCHKSYPRELIETHKRLTHAAKTYKCPFCPRVCIRKSTFNKHISTHDENRMRSYVCEQCGSKFLAESYLKRHMSTQHKKNRKREFGCELCEKKFYTANGLKYHKRTHTGETVSCEVCGAHFLHDHGLKKHMLRKHTAKTQQLTSDPQTANDSAQTKVELVEDEKFLDEGT